MNTDRPIEPFRGRIVGEMLVGDFDRTYSVYGMALHDTKRNNKYLRIFTSVNTDRTIGGLILVSNPLALDHLANPVQCPDNISLVRNENRSAPCNTIDDRIVQFSFGTS